MRKNYFTVIASVLISCLLLCGCKSSKKTVLDYGDAQSFEAALEAGENLEGKTVQFVADEIYPQSAYGYNVWAGNHLNFISSRNPDIKEGDVVNVKVTTIESNLGSWFITYEKIENAEIGEITIQAGADDRINNASSQSELEINTGITVEKPAENYSADTDSNISEEESENLSEMIEFVDADIVAFKGYFGQPQVSSYVSFKNIGNQPLMFEDMRIEYQDDDGNLLTVDDMVKCIPEVLLPGETGYAYSYYKDLDGVDLSNGLQFIPDGRISPAKNPYTIEVSDVSFKTSSFMDIEVTARGTNNTGRDHDLALPGAVFFDKDNRVVGFCYGVEGFLDGQAKAFDISGDLMSEDYNPGIVDHVEVYIQGYEYF